MFGHNGVEKYTTPVASTASNTIHFSWLECKRCGKKAISSHSPKRTDIKEWSDEWEVAPFSNYTNQIEYFRKAQFETMLWQAMIGEKK